MKQGKHKISITGFLLVALLLFFNIITGCANTKSRVIPVGNPEVAALSAEDIARVMLRAGFTDEQILELGTDLRNELSQSGAAQIYIDGKVEAIFAVSSKCIYVSSRTKGSFVYDLNK
jgi:hypothetical protein